MRLRRASAILGMILAALAFGSCSGEPPNQEIQQAQDAVDAARRAGADTYARDELTGAVDALQRAHDAVEQRDYRLALGSASESRALAESATALTTAAIAAAHAAADRAIADLGTALADTRTAIDRARAAGVTTRRLARPRARLTAAERALQEARTSFEGEDYAAAQTSTIKARAELDAVAAELKALTKPPARRRP